METATHRDVATAVFERLRIAFPKLRMELRLEDPNVDITMEIPAQAGLVFKVNVNLQGDELHLRVGDHLWVEWFPCSDSGKVEEYEDTVKGILAGRYRV